MSKFWQSSVVCIIGMLLSACGLAEPNVILPTATATGTPISTALPAVETAVPAGFSEDNPIQIVIVPADAESATENETVLEDILSQLVTVAVDVVIAETQAEAAELVCNSGSGTQSVAWVDGMTYATIQARGCGIGGIQRVIDEETGTTGVLLLRRDEPLPAETDENTNETEEDIEDPTLAGSIEGTFCRVSVDSVFGWTLPVIYYAAESITVLDLNDVNELDDNPAIIEALVGGQCDAAGMLESEWETALDEAEDDLLERSVFVVHTTPEVPFNVLAFPFSISLDVITQLEDAFVTLDIAAGRSAPDSTDADTAEDTSENENADADTETDAPSVDVDATVLDTFFGEGSLQRTTPEDFADLQTLLDESGINFAELGN